MCPISLLGPRIRNDLVLESSSYIFLLRMHTFPNLDFNFPMSSSAFVILMIQQKYSTHSIMCMRQKSLSSHTTSD